MLIFFNMMLWRKMFQKCFRCEVNFVEKNDSTDRSRHTKRRYFISWQFICKIYTFIKTLKEFA